MTEYLLEDDDEDVEDTEDESEETDDAASADKGSEESSSAKRIRELQSKADKAEARANKLEKQLSKAQSSSARVDKGDGGAVPPEVKEWLSSVEGRLRDSLYAEDPRFSQYKLDPELITGGTPAEMQDSQKQLREFVDKMESEIRNAVLVEHGFRPEPKASPRSAPVNYATMTSEEFAKIEAEALSGGMLRRS
jgi:hypothetical protein